MAGTAEGARRATAARIAKAAERRARLASQPQTVSVPTVATVESEEDRSRTLAGPLTVGSVEKSTGVENPTVSRLEHVGVGALNLVERVIEGQVKAPAAVRVGAALKVLDLIHGGRDRRDPAEAEHESTLAKLAQALGARMPRAPITVDAEPASSSREPDPVS